MAEFGRLWLPAKELDVKVPEVQILSHPNGGVDQLVDRLVVSQEVASSNLVAPEYTECGLVRYAAAFGMQ